MSTAIPDSSAPVLRVLAQAPHRLLFLAGACNVVLAMLWWGITLFAMRWHVGVTLPAPSIPAGWAHAIVMQYQVLPPFMFGFLLTVFPRWMNLPSLTRWHYLPIGLGLLGGQVLTLVGLLGHPVLVWLGLLQTLAGWLVALGFLVALLWSEEKTTWHAVSCAVALGFGAIGLMLVFAWQYSGNPRLMFAAIKIGSFALLLPIYMTVAHRMFPFFASVVVPGYRMFRPMWALAAMWLLCLVHLGLELTHTYAWLWASDLPLTAISAWLMWRWRVPLSAPALLRVLFAGYAWLPVAMLLYSAQSLWLLASGEYALGRAPAHALFIGFFGSLLVAMVTRVTQGHSGRPLELGRLAVFAFFCLQLVTVLRIGAELVADSLEWQAIAAALWLVAFLPWVLGSLKIYLSPRVDGKVG